MTRPMPLGVLLEPMGNHGPEMIVAGVRETGPQNRTRLMGFSTGPFGGRIHLDPTGSIVRSRTLGGTMSKNREEALEYHSRARKGKIEVTATKPLVSQRDLSLAYTPGVAEPCRDIHKNEELAYDYTAKGHLGAGLTNGTAVLGLGNIGALAGKPIMEGKASLFKKFADIDVFDVEVDETDVDKFVEAVKAIAPTFGGINLEHPSTRVL